MDFRFLLFVYRSSQLHNPQPATRLEAVTDPDGLLICTLNSHTLASFGGLVGGGKGEKG